jgi:hypothetical protein
MLTTEVKITKEPEKHQIYKKEGGVTMHRWHFNNCKFKIKEGNT